MKTCFKCGRTLPLGEFYRHPMMADGHLGKCKHCTRSDTRANRAAKLEYYRAYDRARRPRKRPVFGEPWHKRFPQKRKAHWVVGNAVRDRKLLRKPCERCGDSKAHAHHDDYTKPLDVRWLCTKHHAAEHHRGLRS